MNNVGIKTDDGDDDGWRCGAVRDGGSLSGPRRGRGGGLYSKGYIYLVVTKNVVCGKKVASDDADRPSR